MCNLSNLDDVCILVGCYGGLSQKLNELNPGRGCTGLFDPARGVVDTKNAEEQCTAEDASHLSFASSLSYDGMELLAAPNPAKGSRVHFGSLGVARPGYFVLPQDGKDKKHHFNIFVNDQYSWMMHILSKATVNDEKLRKGSQVALHPKDGNVIMIESYNFVIFVVKDPVSSGLSPVGPDFLNCSQGRDTQLTSSSTSKSSNTFRHRLPQLPDTVFHKINKVAGRSSNHEMIYRSTGKHVIGKFYGTKDEQAAKTQYSLLSNVLKVLIEPSISS